MDDSTRSFSIEKHGIRRVVGACVRAVLKGECVRAVLKERACVSRLLIVIACLYACRTHKMMIACRCVCRTHKMTHLVVGFPGLSAQLESDRARPAVT